MLTVRRTRAGLLGLSLVLGLSVTAWAQQPLTLAANVAGNTVTLNWTPEPLALDYELQAAPQGGAPIQLMTGNVTTLNIPGVPFGIYLARIRAAAGPVRGPWSNIVTIVVSPGPPPAPTNLGAIVSGTGALLTWTVPAGTTGLLLQAGTSSGGSDIGTIPLPVGTSLPVGGLNAGDYFVRLFAQAGGGISAPSISAPSSEFQLTIPGCSASVALPLSLTSSGGFVAIVWPAVPGATGYQLDVSSTLGGGPDLLSLPLGATTTRFTHFGVPAGDYFVTLFAQLGCGAMATSGQQKLVATNASGPGPRTPDPAPGQALPRPSYGESVVNQVGREFPGDLFNSCVEHGGNNRFLFRVVERLRQRDSRWGLNWKRGNRGDLSQDVVTYHYGPGPDEDSTQVYLWDMIIGHCGGRPGTWFADVTEATRQHGTIGRWTLQPYLRAGFLP